MNLEEIKKMSTESVFSMKDLAFVDYMFYDGECHV